MNFRIILFDYIFYVMINKKTNTCNSDEDKQILKARRFAMEVSLKFAMRKQAEKKQKKQAQQMQRQRAVAIMCKIYVGSIYYEIGEATIKQSFETFGPVRSIDMSYDLGTQRHKGKVI